MDPTILRYLLEFAMAHHMSELQEARRQKALEQQELQEWVAAQERPKPDGIRHRKIEEEVHSSSVPSYTQKENTKKKKTKTQ
jgi:hypothetical protein